MRRVTKLRMGDMINLEVRREKLRNMLSQEEEDLVRKHFREKRGLRG